MSTQLLERPEPVNGRVTSATVGREFTASVMQGGQKVDRDYTVNKSCGTDSGQWFCVTHGDVFRNQFEKDSHIHRGKHELVWICLEHGPEMP